MPISYVPHEEEAAIERELELWIYQHTSIQQRPSVPTQSHLHSRHTQSLPHPRLPQSLPQPSTQSLPHPNRQQYNECELRQGHLPRQQSQPYHGKTTQQSLLDTESAEAVMWSDPLVSLRPLPGSVLHNKNSKHNTVSTALTFPRAMPTDHSTAHYHHYSLPRKFPTIPAIKPISPDDPEHARPLLACNEKPTHVPIPHIPSTRRKSIIPDPNHETSALYSTDEIGKEFVLGGTLTQLVNSLTDERADIGFIEDFLYTYRYFTTADCFLEALQRRYLYAAPPTCSAEEKAQYDEWRGPVQLRVINCFKKWIEEHFHDFELDRALLDKIRSFIFSTISLQNPKWATSLEEIIHAQLICSINSGDRAIPTTGLQSLEVLCALLKQSDLVQHRKWRLKNYKPCFVGQEAVDWMMLHMGLKSRQIVCNLCARLVSQDLIVCVSKDKNEFRDTQHSFYQFTVRAEEILSHVLPSTPILPKNTIEMNLSNVAPKEIARQLTLIEFDIFKSIKLQEISWQTWNKHNGKDSMNVVEMIDRFNQVGFWVASEVVSQKQLTCRVAILKKLIKIAYACKKINNFNTMMEIAVGLNMGSVARLVKTWGAIDTKTKLRYDEIMLLTHSTHNYKNYREALKTATFPVLPYLGLYLRDLTFIEDGNSNFIADESEVNFLKMRMLAKIFKSISEYQQHGYYNFTPVPQLRQYLLQGVTVVKNDTELYRHSYHCESSRNSVKLSTGS
jgi:hypothetical protein